MYFVTKSQHKSSHLRPAEWFISRPRTAKKSGQKEQMTGEHAALKAGPDSKLNFPNHQNLIQLKTTGNENINPKREGKKRQASPRTSTY